MSRGTTTVSVACPDPACEDGPLHITIQWVDDPGCRWHRDGSGTPPSFEWEAVEVYPATCPGGHPVTEEYLNEAIDQYTAREMMCDAEDVAADRSDERYDRMKDEGF